MTTIVKQVLHPLLVMCLIFGIGIYSQEKMYLSILYNITIWIGYSYLYYYTVITFEIEHYYRSSLYLFNLVCESITCIALVILSVFYNKRFQIFLKRLEAVDCTLAKLDNSQTYKQLQRYIKRIIIVWIIYFVTGIVSNINWCVKILNTRWCILIPFVTHHIYHVTIIVDGLFLTLLWYIGTKFDKVTEHVRCLLIEKEHELRCTWSRQLICNNMKKNNYKHIFWTSMHLHLELSQLARELNTMFETHMILRIMSSFSYIPIMLIYSVTHYRTLYINYNTLIPEIGWISYQVFILLKIIRIFYLNYVCETVSAKAKTIEKVINQMTYFTQYADIYDEIHQFVLHHPLKFTAFGLFLGYNFLQKFITRSITFLVFVLQELTERNVPFTEQKVFEALLGTNIEVKKNITISL